MEKLFKLKQNNTTVKTEIIAGLTTFLAMAYILALNPSNLGLISGVDKAAVFMGTALSAAIATYCMAFFSNYPVALASGVGLSAFFTFTVCLSMEIPYSVALTAVFVEGIVFMVMSLFKFREALVNRIPSNLKLGISTGIGLFITIIGLKNAGVIIGDASTMVTLGDMGTAPVVLAMVGLLIIATLVHFKVPGGILLGIVSTWVLGIVAELCGWYVPDPEAGVYSVIPNLSWEGIKANFVAPALFNFDFAYITKNVVSFVIIIFTFLYADIFDTVGTLIGVAHKAELLDENGELPNASGALMADAVGTTVGACLGVPTVTSYVESTAGAAAGGRTGLTSFTTATLFLIAIIFAPIFLAIPGFATTPALVYVGLLMLSTVKEIDFTSDIADTVGAFLAIIMMPFAYSIATGIMFAVLAWTILKLTTGKIKDISGLMWVTFALFAVYMVLTALHIV